MQQQPEWPSNGIEFNRWYIGLGRFIRVLQAFYWGNNPKFKYVNLRIDTRNGNFLVLTDDKDRVDPNEIAKHVDMSKVDDAFVRFQQTGVELFRQAKAHGWKDDGEGAIEFMLRRTREVAIEDCGPDLSHELRAIRDRMVKHHNEGNTYEMGYSTSLSSLRGFIQEIDQCLSSKT